MNLRMRDAIRFLIAVFVISSTTGVAGGVDSAVVVPAGDNASHLSGFLTLESIMLFGVVLLALVVIGRNRSEAH